MRAPCGHWPDYGRPHLLGAWVYARLSVISREIRGELQDFGFSGLDFSKAGIILF